MTSSPDVRWLAVQDALNRATRVIDLGCGAHPIPQASVAVDRFIEPEQRALGAGQRIDVEALAARGVTFVNARIDAPLPFADHEFDFAYSAHVMEHVDDPETACREMMRIARAGAIITPAVFGDIAFGRPYHRWLVMDGPDALFFFEKRPEEDRPFGDHPNPLDALLNDGDWFHGPLCETGAALRETFRDLYYGHRPPLEMIFLWRAEFSVSVIRRA